MSFMAPSKKSPEKEGDHAGEELSGFRVGKRGFRLECITDVAGIGGLRSEWKALEQKCSAPFTYFQSFDWCYQWCLSKLDQDRISREAEPRVYVLRCDGDIVMLWPMMIVTSRSRARILTFLTDPLAQYANVLVDAGCVNMKVGRKAWKLIRRNAAVDAITFNYFPSGSFLDSLFSGVGFAEKSNVEASILDLDRFETWEEHHAGLSKNQRKQRNRRRTKLEKLGKLTLDVSVGGSRPYAEYVYQALEMKRTWLNNTGRKQGVIGEAETGRFLSGLCGKVPESNGCTQGALTLALCLDGKPIAIEIGMVMGKHYYSYLGAFDWQWKDYSPGNVQIEAAQKWAKSVGIEKFDFLGDPSEYKGQWTDESHGLNSRSIPLTVLGLVYCAIWKSRLRPKLKDAYKNMASDRRRVFSRLAETTGRMFAIRNGRRKVSAPELKKTL